VYETDRPGKDNDLISRLCCNIFKRLKIYETDELVLWILIFAICSAFEPRRASGGVCVIGLTRVFSTSTVSLASCFRLLYDVLPEAVDCN
jgi:hypothetical protein